MELTVYMVYIVPNQKMEGSMGKEKKDKRPPLTFMMTSNSDDLFNPNGKQTQSNENDDASRFKAISHEEILRITGKPQHILQAIYDGKMTANGITITDEDRPNWTLTQGKLERKEKIK